jgi:hypothetical protein
MKDRRRDSKRPVPPVWNPNETQDIRHTLIEAGRQDLADGIIMRGIRNLEARIDAMELEVNGVKQSLREQYTDSGIWAVVKSRLDSQKVGWLKWGIRLLLMGIGGAILEALRWLILRAMR